MSQEQGSEVSTEVVAEGTFAETAPLEGAEVVAEEGAEKPAAAPEVDSRMAAKFAALSRKERQIRDRERQLQQQMTELEKRMEAMKSSEGEVAKYKSMPERLRKEPLKVLEESGLTMDEFTEMLLNGGSPTKEMEMRDSEKRILSKVEELEKKLADKEKAEAEGKYEQQLEAFVADLTKFANDEAEYELIRANDAVSLVYSVIEQHHSETGEILSNKDACDAVEEYLLGEAKKLVDREKVKKLFGADNTASKPAPGKQSVTLSNTQASQVPTTGKRKLSNDESIAEAAKLIRWQD